MVDFSQSIMEAVAMSDEILLLSSKGTGHCRPTIQRILNRSFIEEYGRILPSLHRLSATELTTKAYEIRSQY